MQAHPADFKYPKQPAISSVARRLTVHPLGNITCQPTFDPTGEIGARLDGPPTITLGASSEAQRRYCLRSCKIEHQYEANHWPILSYEAEACKQERSSRSHRSDR